MFFFALVILIYGFYCYFIIGFINKMFKKYEYLHAVCLDAKSQYPAFIREDFPLWNKKKFYLVGLLITPFRIIGIIVILLNCLILTNLIVIGYDLKKPLTPFRRKFLKKVVNFSTRSLLFCIGFYKIEHKTEYLNDYDPIFPKSQNPSIKKKAPIIISNHVSWADAFYYCSSDFCPSFIAKAEVSTIPVVGKVAKALQTAFVDRDSRENKDAILNMITNRCKNYLTETGWPQLLIFPEGTSTNGKGLLSFKRGAFNDLKCIQISCLEYPHAKFNPLIDDFGMALNLFMALFQFRHKMIVHTFDILDPEVLQVKNSDDWEIVAKKAKEIMTKCLKAEDCSQGYRDCLNFTQLLKDKKVIQSGKFNPHNEFSPKKEAKKEI